MCTTQHTSILHEGTLLHLFVPSPYPYEWRRGIFLPASESLAVEFTLLPSTCGISLLLQQVAKSITISERGPLVDSVKPAHLLVLSFAGSVFVLVLNTKSFKSEMRRATPPL